MEAHPDSSLLHQHVLKALPNVPWVDHTRVAAFGFRFGANVAVRLAYLESPRLKAVACLGPVVHTLLSDFKCQQQVPEMYLDVLASRLGMHDASDEALRVELNRYSLKVQGLLGRRCPTPMLSGYWKNDPFSPEEDSRLITSSSADGKLLEIPFNPVYRNFDKGLQEITDWIEKTLVLKFAKFCQFGKTVASQQEIAMTLPSGHPKSRLIKIYRTRPVYS